MKWSLQWGPHIKAFEEQSRKAGKPIGPLKSRPQIQQADLPYYIAFQTCGRSRPVNGMGFESPIPISEVRAFCDMVGIANRDERVKYLNLIQELDAIALDYWAEKRKNTK